MAGVKILENMDYKMLVLDLDDSLLGSDLKISSRNEEALLAAIQKGVLVTIATGRMFSSTIPYVEQLGIDIPIITYQGALIKNALSHKTLLHIPIEWEVSMDLIRDSKENGYYIQGYIDDKYYMEEENEYSDFYHTISGRRGIVVSDLEEYAQNREVTKFIIIDEPEKVLRLRDRYEDLYGDRLQVTISKPQFLEFTHRDATKGKAIECLADMLDIDREAVIAVGDSYNDLSMIEFAGLGVAMGNAPDEVRKVADYVTLSNDEAGVAHVIEKFILRSEPF